MPASSDHSERLVYKLLIEYTTCSFILSCVRYYEVSSEISVIISNFHFLKFVFILYESQGSIETDMERYSICYFTQLAKTPRPSPCQILGLGDQSCQIWGTGDQGPPCAGQGLIYLSYHLLLAKVCISRKLCQN